MKLRIAIIFTLYSIISSAQQMPIILKAMYDEQQRSMKQLKLEGHEAPFYISYEISDLKTYYYSAQLGALLQSGSRPVRSKNMRVLVGDYEFNDESIDNDIFTAPQPNEIDMPLEDDYDGIRRSLWVTTDAIYRSAAQHFKENQNTLKEKGKPLKDIPHRTFAIVTPQISNRYKEFPVLKDVEYENYVRSISSHFKNNPDIFSATVSLSIIQGNQYYLNTEGTSSIAPVSNIMLQIQASKNQKFTSRKQLLRYYSSIEKLPTLQQLESELKSFTELVASKKDKVKVDEEYSGPVLFSGEAVAEVLRSVLFGRESLIASNNLEMENRVRLENSTALDGRVGKPIVNETFTVKAKPKLKTFDGLELMGSFEIDDEGVTPPDELVLIEKGILKNLLNDRSLLKPDQTANGHANGPGVIEITADGSQTSQTIKKLLLDKAKEESLSYAYIVRRLSMEGMGSEIYRINVTTGAEERVDDAQLAGIQLKNLRKAKATSDKLKAYNLPNRETDMVSFICPEMLLIDDLEIVSMRFKEPDDEETVFVERPKN